MARLYSNENFPLPVVEKLRALGHDVLTIQETGKADQALADAEVLKLATAENRAVLTLNRRHFIGLHRASPAQGGLLFAPLTRILPGKLSEFTKPSVGRVR